MAQGRHLSAPARVRGRRLARPEQLRRGSRREEGHEGRDERARRRPRRRQRLPHARTRVKPTKRTARPAPPTSGIELTRQYYLRVVSARDGSPAAKAGLRTGDFIRAIDEQSTRDMSVVRRRRGCCTAQPGSKVVAARHPRQRRRSARSRPHARAGCRRRSDVEDGRCRRPATSTSSSSRSARRRR